MVRLRHFAWLVVFSIILSSSIFAQDVQSLKIDLVQSDGVIQQVEFTPPKVRLDGPQKILDWSGASDDFLLAVASEIQSIGEKFGTDVALQLLKVYADLGLKGEDLARGLAFTRSRENLKVGSSLTVVFRAHQNAAEAITFLNDNLKSMRIPIQYSHQIDNTKADPFVPRSEEAGKVKFMETARSLTGPGVIAIGVATGQAPLDTPLFATSALQTAYELQFANSWMNRNVWTHFFGFTGKARKFLLGLNPGVLAINFAYPVSLYEFRRAFVERLGTDANVLEARDTAYPLFALGALIFTAAYGRLQDDLIVLRNTGRQSEGQRYIRESMANIAANAFRVATVFVPFVIWQFQVGNGEYKVDVGTIGLAGLALFATLPLAIKTSWGGPQLRAAYVRASMSRASALKVKCLKALDRLANGIALRTR